jgi:hypothetical protein
MTDGITGVRIVFTPSGANYTGVAWSFGDVAPFTERIGTFEVQRKVCRDTR